MIFVDDIHKHNLQLVPTIHQISHRSTQFLYKSSLKGKKKRKKKIRTKKKSYSREETRARAREINYTDSRQA